MTRHTYRPGDAIDPGATYYPMDGARQCDPLEPEEAVAALDAHMEHTGIVDAMAPVTNNPNDPELAAGGPGIPGSGRTVYVGEPNTDHWSPWLEWRGGPCPLPPGVDMDYHFSDGSESPGMSHRAHWDAPESVHWAITRFRYRSPDPAGWLPRGDWIPPDALFTDACPVRVDARAGDTDLGDLGSITWPDWHHVTHIRLIARQPQAGLPEAQPEPGAVPELPEFVTMEGKFGLVSLQCGREVVIGSYYTPDDLDRIAEACTKLAARERARRAQS